MNIGSESELALNKVPRRERERRQRRADILRGAETVFAARGFHAASIEQIASAAEYATGTVYLYFRDKEALYLELFEEKIRELGELVRQRIDGLKDPLESIRQLVAARMEYFEKNKSFFRIYAREGLNWDQTPHDSWSGVMRLYEEYLELLASLLASGQRRGTFRKGNPRQFAVALSGMMIQLTRDQLRTHQSVPLTDLTPLVLDLFLNGMTAKGRLLLRSK